MIVAVTGVLVYFDKFELQSRFVHCNSFYCLFLLLVGYFAKFENL